MRKLLLATALLVPGWAYAGGYHDPAPPVVMTSAPVAPSVLTPAAVVPNGAVTSSSGASASSRSRSSSSSSVSNAVNVSGGSGWGRNTPDVILGSVSGGNPCGLGVGAGGSGQGIGGLLTWMWEGSGCQRNEDAKLLHNLGFSYETVKNRLCDGSKYRTALAYGGSPCATDPRLPQWEAAWRSQGYHRRADGGWVR